MTVGCSIVPHCKTISLSAVKTIGTVGKLTLLQSLKSFSSKTNIHIKIYIYNIHLCLSIRKLLVKQSAIIIDSDNDTLVNNNNVSCWTCTFALFRGGLIDKPGKSRDFYHTCYTLRNPSIKY